MNREKLISIISNKKCDTLIKEFSVEDISRELGYKDSMALAYDLFFQNLYNEEIQEFAMELFFAIQKFYPSEWRQDWKNDAFLGKLCSITWRYEDMYKFYKQAYDRLVDVPDSLLLLMASCNSVPGTPPISDEASEGFIKRAVAKNLTYESALMMRGIAKNKAEEEYWADICEKLEKNNIHTETIIPDIFSFRDKSISTSG